MKKVAILLVLAFVVVALAGCQSQTVKRTNRRNWAYLKDDGVRMLGLDQPSSLHARDLEPPDAYEPYRGYP